MAAPPGRWGCSASGVPMAQRKRARSPQRMACSGRAWVKATAPYRRACRLLDVPCSLCGQPIDYAAHPNARRAFTVDHVISLLNGGPPLDPRNWRPAHRGCNSREGNRMRQRRVATHVSTRW